MGNSHVACIKGLRCMGAVADLGYVGIVVYAYCTLPPSNTLWHMLASSVMMGRCNHKLSACEDHRHT